MRDRYLSFDAIEGRHREATSAFVAFMREVGPCSKEERVSGQTAV